MLRGFHEIAGQRNWLVLNVQGPEGVVEAVRSWDPHVCVVGPVMYANSPQEVWADRRVIGMNVHSRLAEIPAVRSDDRLIGAEAATHLLAKGFKTFSTFAINHYPWSDERCDGFIQTVTAASGRVVDPLYLNGDNTQLSMDQQAAVWLRALPKGTAVIATCDEWGAILVLACRLAGIAVPEDVAVIGVDDDDLVCEMCQPHMSSVRIPWQEIGRTTARMVESVLRTDKSPMKIVRLPPSGVVERRSTELLAAGHPVVVQALRYLRSQAHEPINVQDVVHQVTTNRRWLERAFRTHLGRSILQEIRRAHMDRARHLLATTRQPMTAIARSCGFGSAIARFSRTFNKDVGMTPSAYRRKFSLNR